ncbi:MAG TPA: ATP-binding protein, partial [Ktedonobacteraceae bacterium]|nr:ATP-binding protein [Ktedonobacteraceae bacterium]
MFLGTFFTPTHLLQVGVLALSIFDLTAFLWLASTVWLNGKRQAGIVRLGVLGLGLSAVFFFIHSLLVSSPVYSSFPSLDFWWRLIWIPALGVPYIWFTIGLYYAAVMNSLWRRRRPLMLVIGGILGTAVAALLLFNRDILTFNGTILLFSGGNAFRTIGETRFFPLILTPILFLVYVTFCAIGPWSTSTRLNRLGKIIWRTLFRRKLPASGPRLSLYSKMMEAFWDDPVDVELLEEPLLSWHLARPGLLLAALLMVGLTTTLSLIIIQSVLNWLGYSSPLLEWSFLALKSSGLPFPPGLFLLDFLATGSVAFVILLIGYSIVRHGVLIERPLPRRGFFEQWRGIVFVSALVALMISLMVDITDSSLGALLLITCLATVAYALFTWSSYTAHDRYVSLLAPFMRNTNQRHWLNTDLPKTEQNLEHLFFHLCHDVLAVQFAYLSVVAGAVRRSFSYRWPADLLPDPGWKHPLRKLGSDFQIPRLWQGKQESVHYETLTRRVQVYSHGRPIIIWILPIYNERGLAATLYLGPREDRGAFTDEDMNLAHACGQRILDTLGDHEAMQAVASLLRRRIVDVKLLGAHQRRVLHDEILPQMHLALLQLEMLRSVPENARNDSAPNSASAHLQSQSTLLVDLPVDARRQVLDEAINYISDNHRRLAAMMRATAPGAPHRLESDGLINAISTMLEQDFQNAFDEIDWNTSEETAACIDELISPAIAELLFAAVQEALRNAARHARGNDVHRRLRITLKASCSYHHPHLELLVADNGVGIASASGSTTGTGGGLLTHSALLAIAGGSLTITSAPSEGVTVRIILP